MAKTNMFQDILENAAKKLGKLVRKLKKMDRRFLILAGVATVLVIIMLALIVHGIRANKEDEETTSNPDISNIYELPSDEAPDVSVELNGAGMYKINTGDSPFLNMRLAADKNSEVVTTIPNGTEIEIMFIDDSAVESEGDYGWGYVNYNGKRGWIFMEYVEK